MNPASGVRVIGRRDEGSEKVVPPTKEEVKAVLRLAEGPFRLMVEFSAATGVRAGELHALRWRHIDFKKAEVRVETRVDRYRNEDGQGTKTAKGNREVPIGEATLLRLKEWRLQSRYAKDHDLLFPNKRGEYMSHDNMVDRKFNALFEKLAKLHSTDPAVWPLVNRFKWHSLRHFAISCWIEAGLSPKTVQTYAGHASLKLTMDRYGHMFKSADHKAAMDEIAKSLFEPD